MSALLIDQNDDEVLDVTVLDKDGNPADLANCTLAWAVRPSKGSSTVLLSYTTTDGIDIVPPSTDGVATITIPKADTTDILSRYLDRTLVWQLDAVDSTNKEVTLARGEIVIRRDLVL